MKKTLAALLLAASVTVPVAAQADDMGNDTSACVPTRMYDASRVLYRTHEGQKQYRVSVPVRFVCNGTPTTLAGAFNTPWRRL